ncbi:PREDICTED: uncharacterized protein LOC106323826 [Brassica oleracea var. oleracea]|uniref:uncharacterized protein LOC106323826 n=1 Tax=Brassica oleracea var. oleracea TaxID=109376 RepID=UPI0006A6E5D5|nr:PREDICTED: uncharacterized protein LOC106323826 [Brassica oleracea var. oleracea]
MKSFLGIELCKSNEGLFISQRKYALDLLKDAGAYGGRTSKMPMEDGYKVPRDGEIEDNKLFYDPKMYRKLVGKLIFLTITRPDICFAANQVIEQTDGLQHATALSLEETCYAKATNELVWIKGILRHLEIEQATPMTMHCDNQAAIHIATNSVFYERTKQIEVDCHKVRQMIVLVVILPCYTRSEDQLADVFTKAAR